MKIGDRVKLNYHSLEKEFDSKWIKWAKEWFNSEVGTIEKIINYRKILNDPRINYLTGVVHWDNEKLNSSYKEFREQDLIINNKKIFMKITNLVKQILDQDTRKLVKAGYIDGELSLTEDGVSELIGMIFAEKKPELVKLAEEKINEENSK